MKRSDRLRRLHFVNALFSSLTGQDLYLAQQIDAAITESFHDTAARPPAEEEFASAAGRLLERLCGHQPRHGFFHWDAGGDAAGDAPLFALAHVNEGMRRLAAYPESTLLVTNLRTAHCPPHRRWTTRRSRDYDDTLSLLNETAARRARPDGNVTLFFL